jgi:DNA-binding transcriptional regulator LsrR (DeoR family)
VSEPGSGGADLQRRVLLAELSRAYYLDDVSKVDIAKAFGMSRFQVARLLEQARATGVVSIEVHDPRLPRSDREVALADALGVDTARIVELDETDDDRRVEQFGAVVLTAMRDEIRPGMTIGVSWSRALDRAARFLPALPPCSVVQLTGAFEVSGSGTFNRMLMQLDRRAGIQTYPLYAPLVVDQRSTAEDLRRQPVIADALAHAEALDLAVVAIGAWLPGESAVWEKVTPEVQQACTRAGAVAEFSGNFLNAQGATVQTPLDGRVIAIGLPQLQTARNVIGFAYGPRRATALRAAVASGAFSSVIVDSTLASAVLGSEQSVSKGTGQDGRTADVTDPRRHRARPAAGHD